MDIGSLIAGWPPSEKKFYVLFFSFLHLPVISESIFGLPGLSYPTIDVTDQFSQGLTQLESII